MADPKKLLAGVGLFAVGVAAILAGGVGVYYLSLSMNAPQNAPTDTITPSDQPMRAEPRTEGFAQLISVTNRGFEPAEPTMLRSERVRFINTSSQDVWIEAVSSSDNLAYPGTSECSESALDSCKNIAPGGIWEFELEEAGVWMFRNKINPQQTGLIRVQ